jgi:hypothetical protein
LTRFPEDVTVVRLIALIASLCIAVPCGALAIPSGSTSFAAAKQQQESSAIDRWISHPTRIVLTRDQQERFDSLRVKYSVERKVVSEVAKTEGEMGLVLKMRDLDSKFQRLVRALLTAEQQEVFDENLRAGFLDPRP